MTVQVTKSRSVEVASYAEASKAILAQWNGKSSRAFYGAKGVGVVTVDGAPTAHVSYNGRVWEGVDRFGSGKAEIVIAAKVAS